MIAAEQAKVALNQAIAMAARANAALERSTAASAAARGSRLPALASSLQARVYELEAANTGLERRLTRGDGDAAHRDKRARPALGAVENAVEDATSCVVCRDRPRSLVIIPCAHACLCSACATSIMATSTKCPICREKIASTTAFRLA